MSILTLKIATSCRRKEKHMTENQTAVETRQQKQVKVYNDEMQRQGVIDVYRSLIWTRKYFEAGTVELHAPLNSRNLSLLKDGNIIAMTGSVEAAFIEGIATDDYSNEITATGRMLSSAITRRGVKTALIFTEESYETAMRSLVSTAAITSDDPLPNLQLADAQGLGGTVTFSVTYKDCYTYLTKLSKCSNLGFRIRPDFKNKIYYFEVYEGKDRTKNQSANKRVTFSEVYRNLNKATYTLNSQNFKTHAIVFGAGEGTARTVMTATIDQTAAGWKKREVMVDARDISSDGMTTAQYQQALIQRGSEKLAEYGIVECLEAATLPFVNFQYKTDYDLGDIVTVEKKAWSIEMDKRITEIQEIYENGGFTIVPTFGTPLPESVDLSDN